MTRGRSSRQGAEPTRAAPRAALSATPTGRGARVSSTPIAPRLEKRLLVAAQAARQRAYAPYSSFRVGAAVLDERGRVHAGCNVENASYGLTICAERNALAAAVTAGARRICAAAVISGTVPPAPPCGACRQVLAELASDDAPILTVGADQKIRAYRLGDLLPARFALRA